MARLAHGGRKTREGTVVSDKMDKTVVVAVETSMRHRLYSKIVRRLRRYMIHDEANDAKLGDRVRIVESRRYSRKKRWQLAEVLVRADRPEVAAEEIDLELLGEVKVEEEEKAPPPESAAPVEEAAAPEAEAEEAPPEAAPEEVPPEAAPEEVPAVEEAVEPEAEAKPEAKPEAEEEPEPAEGPETEAEPEAEEEPEPAEEPETEVEPEAEEEPEPAEGPETEAEPEGEEKEGSA